MAKTISNLGWMLAALLLILACATPTVTPPPAGFIETSIAGTYSVAASQTAQVKVSQVTSVSLTPAASKIASATPLATFTVVVLGASQVRALVDTPCRKGPGSLFDQVFLFRKGRIADLAGQSPGYWIIRNPNRPEQLCWVERGAVQVIRLTGNVPAMTPPPPPTATRTPTRTPRPPATATFTPSPTIPATATDTNTPAPVIQFDLFYSGLDDCPTTPAWWVNFEVGNTGDVEFESLSITITDNDAVPPTPLTLDSEQFIASNACGAPDTIDSLPVGFSQVISSQALNYDPSIPPSHHIDAEIILCTEPAQGGDCVTKTMSVIP